MFVDLHSAQLSRHGDCTNHRQPSKLMSLEFCQVKEGAARHRPNSRGRLPASAVGPMVDFSRGWAYRISSYSAAPKRLLVHCRQHLAQESCGLNFI